MVIRPIRTRLFKQKESLEDFIFKHVERPPEGSVIVVTSKIVALAQGRVATYANVSEKKRIIQKESHAMLRTPWCWLTFKNDEWCANAGVDESNAQGQLILMPEHIRATTDALLRNLKKRYRRKKLGVIITDTRIYPMRVGTMGVAVGFSGIKGLRSYIGERDIFGRKLKMTKANIVHALSVGAVLVMGEGKEKQPLCVIEDAPVVFTSNSESIASLTVDPCDDLYRAAYAACERRSHGRAKRRRPR